MGIAFDVEGSEVDYPSWSYSGFNRFRSRLANALGLDWDALCEGKAEWPKKDALYPLLFHSDCDGELNPAECEKVAPRLREVLAMIPKDGAMDYDLTNGEALARYMEEAARLKKPLVFC